MSKESWTFHERIQDTIVLSKGSCLLNSVFMEIRTSNPGHYSRMGQEEKDKRQRLNTEEQKV